LKQQYLYLVLDVLTILFPFVFSFYSKANFSRKWKYLWVAILIPGIIFLLWDEFFTQLNVWGFNPEYLTGIYLGSLPLEEVLFFICIPYACVFTYEALTYLVKKDYLASYQRILSTALIAGLTVIAAFNLGKWYTVTTFLGLAAYIVILEFIVRSDFLSRFYFSYIFILIPFFIVNGILTGSFIEGEVVWYNDAENLGIRIGTIPVEDIFYGMLLLMMNVSVFEWLQRKKNYA
jgi:lycopene cyclase domain-containing protein